MKRPDSFVHFCCCHGNWIATFIVYAVQVKMMLFPEDHLTCSPYKAFMFGGHIFLHVMKIPVSDFPHCCCFCFFLFFQTQGFIGVYVVFT